MVCKEHTERNDIKIWEHVSVSITFVIVRVQDIIKISMVSHTECNTVIMAIVGPNE